MRDGDELDRLGDELVVANAEALRYSRRRFLGTWLALALLALLTFAVTQLSVRNAHDISDATAAQADEATAMGAANSKRITVVEQDVFVLQGDVKSLESELAAEGLVPAPNQNGETSPEGNPAVPAAVGERGPPGVPGPPGPTGLPGPIGLPGSAGLAGSAGVAGAKGEPGDAGPPGEAGVAGRRGRQGPAGPQGEQGVPGEAGAVGPTGPAGPSCPEGTTLETIDVHARNPEATLTIAACVFG